MYRTTLALAAILAAAAAGSAGAADLPVKAVPTKVVETPYFLVNENSVSYHYEFTATNPGAGTTPKNVGTFSHFDVWAYGTNFFNLDWLKATSTNTPSNPCPVSGTRIDGASENGKTIVLPFLVGECTQAEIAVVGHGEIGLQTGLYGFLGGAEVRVVGVEVGTIHKRDVFQRTI